jgi:5-(carboxyamino)imidazole ribonucleotide synthase
MESKLLFDQKIGILGGGQLGAMLLRYAIDFGLNLAILEKDPDAPCSRYTNSFHLGDPLNYEDVLAFGKDKDILTIEKEAVNVSALKVLQSQGVKIYPSPFIIETIFGNNQ